ncbi:MAG TPA: phage holin family protein [Anaerolineae bacterium]|nr:phage holin family protein [Anaerolineae bacterium]
MNEWKLTALVRAILAGAVAAITTLLGGWDDAMMILTIFIVLDIISGWIRAFIQKELSSEESFRGTAKKVLIYVIVAVAAQADRLTGTALVRNVVIAWYCATEALSILENTVAAGLPVPEFLKEALKQLNEKKFPVAS